MQKISMVVDIQGKIFKTCVDEKIFYPGSDPKLTLTLTLSLTPGLGLGLTPAKTISVENLKPNKKDYFRRTRSGKDVLNLCRQKNIYFGSHDKVTLTLTLSLTLGLGFGLTPGKTSSVQNLKPNAKD